MTLSNDEELISGYVDGQLSHAERAAFEARLASDAALRRRVAATQLLYREARQLPNAAMPRNFILARDFGQSKPAPAPQPRRSLFPAWVFRIGSAAAALLFVSALAVEVARPAAFSPSSLPYNAPSPVEAPAPAAPMADMAREGLEATVTLGALAESATTNVQPMAATVALPTLDMAQAQTKAESGASVLSSSEANGAAAGSAASPEALLLTATPAPEATVPAAAKSQTAATPEPEPEPAPAEASLPQAQPEPLITPLGALAAIALVAAIVLGALGWLRK